MEEVHVKYLKETSYQPTCFTQREKVARFDDAGLTIGL